MWNRKELKEKGKAAFRANYWKSVLTAIILAIATAGAAGATVSKTSESAGANGIDLSNLTAEQMQLLGTIVVTLIAAAVTISLIGTLVRIFAFYPLEVGCRRFFFVNAAQPAELGELGYGFQNNYWNCVKTILLRDIFLALWALLFVFPAIIKAYSYRMVPYILADDPTIGGTEAITRSREMMNGHKWRAFVLDLSFIGWYILDALTLGILGVFYVHPYVDATGAELYRALKEQA